MEIRPIFSAMMRSKTGVILIALQIALTLAILANALYVVQDRTNEANRVSGVDDANVFMIAVQDKDNNGAIARQKRDEDSLRAIPGVASVALTSQMPLSQSGSSTGVQVDPKAQDSEINASVYFGSETLVKTLGLKIVEGRDFNASEMMEIDESKADKPFAKVALISKDLAKKLYPNEDSALGKIFYQSVGDPPIEIIGVVETLVSPWGRASWNSNSSGGDSFILPARFIKSYNIYAVRTEPGQRDRIMKEAEKSLAVLMPGRLVRQNHSMDDLREERYRGEHTMANGLLIVIGLLLLMTASGIIGLASLWVNQRRKQIGIRRALGARRADILRYFVTENIMICLMGIVLGSGLAIALNRAMMSEMELQRLPLIYLASGAIALLCLGVLAVLGPAWRAAQIAPATATRSA
ncbi:MAG: FtsX-like permease family protein [Arenimonas sp.]